MYQGIVKTRFLMHQDTVKQVEKQEGRLLSGGNENNDILPNKIGDFT